MRLHITHGQNAVSTDRGCESPPDEPGEREPIWMECYKRLTLDMYRFSSNKFCCRLKRRYDDVDKLAKYLHFNCIILSSVDDPLVATIDSILQRYNLIRVGEICGGWENISRSCRESFFP